MACNCDGHSHSKITHWSCDECNGTWTYGNGVVQTREIRFSTDTNFEMNSVQYLLCENVTVKHLLIAVTVVMKLHTNN